MQQKVVENGYIKLLALDVDHFETTIIMERNTNCQYDIDEFKEIYGEQNNILIFIIHMNDDDIKFADYKRVCNGLHPFDYVKNIITRTKCHVIHRNDVDNKNLYN